MRWLWWRVWGLGFGAGVVTGCRVASALVVGGALALVEGLGFGVWGWWVVIGCRVLGVVCNVAPA